jgi:glycosyltransferase involved in cell wall biosynthesis
MPSVRLIYDVEGWAFHRNARDIARFAPADFQVSLGAINYPPDLASAIGSEEPDIIFLLPFWMTRQAREIVRERGWNSKIVVYWNHGWPGKLSNFMAAYRHADFIIINHMEYWVRTGPLQRTAMIPMGVDLDSFKVAVPINERKPKVLWLGSVINRGVKGYTSCVVPLLELLDEKNIDHDIRLIDSLSDDLLDTEELNDYYNSGTVLVVASSQEGTPNVALEAAACGCTLVSTRVGNMPELIRNGVNGFLVDGEPRALMRAIEFAITRYQSLSTQLLKDIKDWDWRYPSETIFQSMRQLLHQSKIKSGAHAAATPDLAET